jgi:hypothetical protein
MSPDHDTSTTISGVSAYPTKSLTANDYFGKSHRKSRSRGSTREREGRGGMADEEPSRNEAAERRAASLYGRIDGGVSESRKESEERGPQSRRGPLEDWFCTQFELSKSQVN